MAASGGLVVGLWLAGQWLGGAAALGVAVGPQGADGVTLTLSGPAISGVAEVIDGDTLRIGSVRLRIQGIDSPEADQLCRRPDGTRWQCGAWSTAVAREMFHGRRLVCEDLGERTHDRVVARCTDGTSSVSEAMLRAGAARACERFALRHQHSQGYMALEAAAEAARLGIFDGEAPPRAGFCTPRAGDRRAGELQQASDSRDCAIKGNINARGERIYHMPGQAHYDRVVIRSDRGQRWFCSEAEAQAAGWRPALR
jgi:endonuclease YncB( thermonuclease family)